jgi:integrase
MSDHVSGLCAGCLLRTLVYILTHVSSTVFIVGDVEETLARRFVVGSFRVQTVVWRDGRRAYTIVDSNGSLHATADRFLRSCAGGTDRTYAYLLVDHLRWLEAEGLTLDALKFRDLERYMAAVGAEYAGPFGRPWREGSKRLKESSLETLAACLKRFYVLQGALNVNASLAEELTKTRLPTQADRDRKLLGHITKEVPVNPLSPKKVVRRRHPKLPPVDARDRLLAAALTDRDRLLVTWLADGGFRIGELCGLHLVDLHLRKDARCGECRARHVHICHRERNANGARAKSKRPWGIRADDVVTGGTIRRVSPAMMHSYFAYMTSEYPHDADHGMLLVSLTEGNCGAPWSPAAAREMLARAGSRAGLSRINPHSFRHQFATDVMKAAKGNSLIARDAGGWASVTTVEQVYGHMDADDPILAAALQQVWGDE